MLFDNVLTFSTKRRKWNIYTSGNSDIEELKNSKSKNSLDKDSLFTTNYKYSLQDYYKYAALCHLQTVIMNISSKY